MSPRAGAFIAIVWYVARSSASTRCVYLTPTKILALRSSYFRNLLGKRNDSAPKPGDEVALNEASYAAVHALLRYCYKPYSMSELSAELLKEIEALNSDLLGVQS